MRMDRTISGWVSAGEMGVRKGPQWPCCHPTPQQPRTLAGGRRGHSLWLRKARALSGIRKEQQRGQGWELAGLARGQRRPFLSGLSWPTCLPSLGFICKSDLIITILPIPLSLETGGPDLKGQKWVYRKWQRLAEARLGKAPPAPLPGSLSASLGDTDLEPISSNEQMGRQARRGEGTCPCCAVLRSHSGQPRPDPAPQVYL